jgi:zinc transport system substrate-binding protein
MFRRLITLAAVALVVASGGAACGFDLGGGGKTTVVTSFYPLQFLAQRIGGDRVAVTNLVPPGTEPHDLELSPKQVGLLSDADLVMYLDGYQPAVDEAVDQNTDGSAFDLAGVEELEPGFVPVENGELAKESKGRDPHVWLDPDRFADLAKATAKRLGEVDGDGAETYDQRADILITQLDTLSQEYEIGLGACTRRTIVTTHNAFGYLAKRYQLEQLAITGLTPEAEPSPARLAEVAEIAKEKQITTVFFETLVSPKVAETLAKDIGAKTAVLDPIEGLKSGASSEDYFSTMRRNLTALRIALGCP